MKKIQYSLLSILIELMAIHPVSAQKQLDNAGFENWETKTINGYSFLDPSSWHTLNRLQQFGFEPSTIKTTNAHQDSFAVILTTVRSAFGSIPGILAGSPFLLPDGTPNMNLNFKAFSDRPHSIQFWYKSFPEQGDENAMQCMLTKWNAQTINRDTIAIASWTTDSTVLEFSLASIPFMYLSNENPDSISIIFSSSLDGFSPAVGSELHLDNVEFTYGNTLAEPNKNIEFTVYPNPFKDKLTIEMEELGYEVQLFSILGELILSKHLEENLTVLDVSNLPNGIYFMNLVQPEREKKLVKKLIKTI
ncbi:MAG: T9SS type A sorting domain-containing protein [Sphingobacteriales bacterium]|nr:T9SS type A sorting domain-containing protein [Sphingobacteriales bacterium]